MFRSRFLMKGIGVFLSALLLLQVCLPVVVYATSGETISTVKYIVKGNYIMRVDPNTTVQEFLKNVSVDSGAEGKMYNGTNIVTGTEILASGMIFKIGTTSYTIIVRGDVNLDGKVTPIDLSLFKMHELGITLLTGVAEKALDVNCDGQISITDRSQLKMILVGLSIPGDEQGPVEGDITILPETTTLVKALGIVVYWPNETTGLTKQISLNNGQTFKNYTEKVTMTQNGIVIARLVNSNSQVVKTATLTVTNIDNVAPEAFDFNAIHKISNYTTVSGSTTDAATSVASYQFSYDDGQTWLPVAGQLEGTYTLMNLPPNSIVTLKMKATDSVGNSFITTSKTQRTFKSGIKILKEKLPNMNVNEENETITLPDGKIYRLAILENGTYRLYPLSVDGEKPYNENEVNEINQKIATFETNGAKTVEEILNELAAQKIGSGILEDSILVVEKAQAFIRYKIVETENGKHQARFLDNIIKNGLTTSAQIAEQETLDKINKILATKTATDKISDILATLITDGLVLPENVNKTKGTFELQTGMVYKIYLTEGNKYVQDVVGLAEEVKNRAIEAKIFETLEKELKNQIIDWAIADGITTQAKANRQDGIYQDAEGKYKQVIIDFTNGTYSTIEIAKPEGAQITYTLTPEFPLMTNKVEMSVTANATEGISKIEIYTEIGEAIFTKTYTETNSTITEKLDLVDNGTYTIKVTTKNNKVSEKRVLISNVDSILPIKVTINPETPRNTAKTEIQNGIATGPVSVTLKFSEAILLTNADKYQYQIDSTSGQWTTATREQIINNITKNCVIYARYFDGKDSVKQVRIDVDNIDNIAPEAFAYTTVANSHSITIKANTTDTAADSVGTPARDGVAGVMKYLYKLNDGEWVENGLFGKLTQNTEYTISVKAVDHAGNETIATNSNTKIRTTEVPNANTAVTFTYSNTNLTKDSVKVTFNVAGVTDTSYKTQYQIITDNSEVNPTGIWVEDIGFEATGNCKIYVRIADTTGQVARDGYAVGTITNIDNQAPLAFTPKAIASTSESITINASGENGGAALDAPQSNTTAISGIAKYTYYLIPSSGSKQVVTDQTAFTYTFANLKQGGLYGVYVEAYDAVGNMKTSQMINVTTNGKVGEIADVNTTITGLKESATYNNPIIPAGFGPINESGVEWGNGTTLPAGWNNGLVIQDKAGNQFAWVPVDGTDVKYEKWLNNGIAFNTVTDGENPQLNETEKVNEIAQIEKYKGFYVARFEASKNGEGPSTISGQEPWTGVRYESAKIAAEKMYTTASVRSGMMTGKQWDTLMKWIQNEKGAAYLTSNTSWGNYGGTKNNTGNSENYKVKNIYDIAGNIQEITNELKDKNSIIRGGAYNLNKVVAERSEYSQEYTNPNLGFRPVLFVMEPVELEPTEPGTLGIGNINKGPGNVTINGLDPSFLNPVIPVGFKAMNTADARWTGLPTPSGWNNGLVIEDVNGNQFVWVPVDGTNIRYEKWYSLFAPEAVTKDSITGDELPLALTELNEAERKQVDKYGGFYIARYEAGNEEGQLASKAGLKVVNGIDYTVAKEYAEGMYNTIYVKSGLPTGTVWDTTMRWIARNNGDSSVNNNWQSGNNYSTGFTFSGEYAIGPNAIGEYRGAYQIGTNVNKPAGQSYLLVTGIVDRFKTNNIFDLAGNVWEYSSEYATNAGTIEHIARGSDYYRPFSTSKQWGSAMRENLTTPPGEIRNEGGFRVVLYLTEGKAEIGKFADYNRTINGEPSKYNNPVIPAGFAAVNKGANWGDGALVAPSWNDGLVIENMDGNEFVWVPVDKSTVEYKKWLTRGTSYRDTDGDETPEKLKEWKEKEDTQVNKYGGFYVARYETSMTTTQVGGKDVISAQSKPSTTPWTNMNYTTAKLAAESMVTKDTVNSGLITGTSWDTVMKWIANEKGVSAVTDDSTSWGYYANSVGAEGAKAKNIFTLAGGSWEMTSEKYGNDRIYRGGVKTDRGDSSPAGYRGIKEVNIADEETTFRMVLYVTGDVIGIATKPVQESKPLLATVYPNKANAPVLSDGMLPIKWTGSSWVQTTQNDKDWYNYADTTKTGENSSKWANAMTPDGSYWVWIPRYAYKLMGNEEIDVIFLGDKTNEPLSGTKTPIYAQTGGGITTSNNYIVHPAFINNPGLGGWDKELSGIWVEKFEATGDGASRPGTGSYANVTGSWQFDVARSAKFGLTDAQKARIDTHMAKNTEWGAVAYLGQSKYGVNGKTIQKSPVAEITGYSYETLTNTSTTGNIYGVYDMAGGRQELVAGYWAFIGEAWFAYGGSYANVSNIVNASAKYRNRYGEYYGDAMGETKNWQGAVYVPYETGWATEESHGNRPQLVRGNSNIFDIAPQCSNANYANGYRITLITE